MTDLILELTIVSIIELVFVSVFTILFIRYKSVVDYKMVRLFFLTAIIFIIIFSSMFQIVWIAKLLGY